MLPTTGGCTVLIMRTIGKRIAAAREKAGLNQSELARALKVTPQSVQAWESDKNIPRPKKLESLAIVLGVSITHLVESEGVSGDEIHDELQRRSGASKLASLRSVPVIGGVLAEGFETAMLTRSDLLLLAKLASALIEKNRSIQPSAPNLPEHLDGLAEAAFTTADQGGDADDLLKMIGHGLSKSVEKDEKIKHGKRKTSIG
ncbi:hypothetical protein ASF66_00920 [Pseudomonas sp. Leaf129]|uniref:helix-turn-helix domain-containing protein n=1 Tax=Pseudomonas sp. Leaf129 TaxID=1736268 RepID=UPI00070331CC|nr:helix-turn-helix transcriptional regulator [Pseudomonas sp. Leaf129]KQQ62948.1 hypothetical protein ASF66_00920 [Pseudomonas sp. Leaf129]